MSRQRCKHVDIKYHFIRSSVNNGDITLVYCPTNEMVADVLTKPATKCKMMKFDSLILENDALYSVNNVRASGGVNRVLSMCIVFLCFFYYYY